MIGGGIFGVPLPVCAPIPLPNPFFAGEPAKLCFLGGNRFVGGPLGSVLTPLVSPGTDMSFLVFFLDPPLPKLGLITAPMALIFTLEGSGKSSGRMMSFGTGGGWDCCTAAGTGAWGGIAIDGALGSVYTGVGG